MSCGHIKQLHNSMMDQTKFIPGSIGVNIAARVLLYVVIIMLICIKSVSTFMVEHAKESTPHTSSLKAGNRNSPDKQIQSDMRSAQITV